MPRIRVIAAIVLAALWLPATQHCGLEAAQLLDECGHADGTSSCAPEEACATDSCANVEDGAYRSQHDTPKLVPPALALWVCLIDEIDREAPERLLTPIANRGGAPDDWIPSWRFVRRAAALAHAPDILIA